ncbi:MAG: DNA cytosine methyltransferase [Candidatus Helarchaeota archaeon]
MCYSVIDLFSGCGGFSLGFQQAGFKIILAIDINPIVIKTIKLNNPEIPTLNADIKTIHSLEIKKMINCDPDIIIASPPCEPYTVANRHRKKDPFMRLYDDPVGQLVLHAIRIIGDLQPRFFVMENVPQLKDGLLKESLIHEFDRVGFSNIYFNMLHAERYGTPSKRTRLFISNVKIKPKKTSFIKNLKISDVLNLFPEPDSIHNIPNHELTPISKKKDKKLKRLRSGDSIIYYRSAKDEMNTNWRKLHGKNICPTIIGHSRYVHPTKKRLLTVREHAKLMGFPDSYLFYGGLSNQYNQIGEAVPVPLSNAIANCFLDHLF